MSATGRLKRSKAKPDGEITPREDLNNYPTPPWVTRVLVNRLGFSLKGKRVLECAAGEGAMAKVLAEAGAILDAVEIDPGRAAVLKNSTDARVRQVVTGSFLDPVVVGQLEQVKGAQRVNVSMPYDVVISNPPYGTREIVIGEDGKPRMKKKRRRGEPTEPLTTYRDLALEFVQGSMKLAPVVAMLLRLNWAGSDARHEFHAAHPADLVVLSKRPKFKTHGRTDAAEYAWWIWRQGASVGTWEVDPCEGAPGRGRPKAPVEIVDRDMKPENVVIPVKVSPEVAALA